MIKNQRPYQFVFSKTNNENVSLFVAACAKFAGACIQTGVSFFGKEYIDFNDICDKRKQMEDMYPKPKTDKMIQQLLPIDENIDISIIIPIYNAEKYITDCMESILNQQTEYSFEIIAVNDNSTDCTMERLEKYKQYENVHIVDFKHGGSAAKARNEGLLHSIGKNIMFVDSDDILPSGAVEMLMHNMNKHSADVVQGGWNYIDENGIPGLFQQYETMMYTEKNAAARFDLPGTPWGKIYKRELFEKIRFPSEYTCFEDAIIHFLVFRKAERVMSIKENVYCWRKNPNGITQTSQNRVKALQSYWIAEEMLEWDKILNLPHDIMYAMCVIGQLSNFCYVNVSGLEKDVQKNIFTLCCELYEKTLADFGCEDMPYAIRKGAEALKTKRFDLWIKQGKLYQLIR